MMPAKSRNRPLLELLMRFGAQVPALSKWGRFYYFVHDDIAAFLLENGMSPRHMSWHGVTLLHDMAQSGDVAKARLLLDHGADINAVDDEYRTTPLGMAARWGQRKMVALLLERGADPNKAGAAWSTPLAWAQKKGHGAIAADFERRRRYGLLRPEHGRAPAVSTVTRWNRHLMRGQGWAASCSTSSSPCACSSDIPC